MTPSLTQISEFQANGILSIKDAIPRSFLSSVQKHLDSELKRLNISKHGSVPSQLRNIPYFQQIIKLGQMIKRDVCLERLIPDELVSFSEKLANTKLEGFSTPQLLLSLPSKKEWSLDHLNWHVDVSAAPDGPVPGVQIFVLIKDVKIHGGATLALAGSHRIAKQSLNIKELPIIEMHGKAGDVFLMDMRIIHSPSINAMSELRMMLTKRFMSKV